jgi:hypothetical protein
MLHFMQEISADSSLKTADDFAGLMAALAAAKPAELPPWSDEELSEDVATLSYESALRTHARIKSAVNSEPVRTIVPTSEPTGPVNPTGGRERKLASVTLRMSKAECEQLRARAAEAGLTVSAYLRLCAFEAEALRAQVKDALAELRRAHAPEPESATHVGMQTAPAGNGESSRGSRLGWLRRMIPDLHAERSLARA